MRPYVLMFQVRGFPTIKLFMNGEVSEYDGGRTSGDIVRWATDKLAENVPPPEMKQVKYKHTYFVEMKCSISYFVFSAATEVKILVDK